METPSSGGLIFLAVSHLIPLYYIANLVSVAKLFQIFITACILIVVYVTTQIVKTNNTDYLASTVIKSGSFLTKSSLTLNDLRLIKFKNIFGTTNTKNSLVENNRKIMSQEVQDDKDKKSISRSNSQRFNEVSSTAKKTTSDKDESQDIEAIDRLFTDCKNPNANGSFKRKHSQQTKASLLTVVIKKNRRF